jgi:hypothetical protein
MITMQWESLGRGASLVDRRTRADALAIIGGIVILNFDLGVHDPTTRSWKGGASLRAVMSIARLWRDQGKRREARELLAPGRLDHRRLRRADPAGRQGVARLVDLMLDWPICLAPQTGQYMMSNIALLRSSSPRLVIATSVTLRPHVF